MNEADALANVVRRLNEQGWTVSLRPRSSDLPKALQGLQVDIFATSGEQIRVVEVTSRHEAKDSRLGEIARRVEAMPNASFEIVWLGDSYPPPDAKDVTQLVEQAAMVLDMVPASGLLMTSAALEVALLIVADSYGVRVFTREMPGRVLASLHEISVVSDWQFADIKRLYDLRNRVAHGVRLQEPVPVAEVKLAMTLAQHLVSPQFVPVDEIVDWFLERFVPADRSVDLVDGVIDAEGSLSHFLFSYFMPVDERSIDEAVEIIGSRGREWVAAQQAS